MLFVSLIQGPASEEDFVARCAEYVLPQLEARQITAALWTTPDRSDFYLHGFLDRERPDDVSEVVERAGWAAQTLALWNVHNPFSGPGGRIMSCAMPFNPESIDKDDAYKTCTAQKQHKILDKHDVTYCPACGGQLK
ncbi:MAG TPA: hypothetical protein VH637_00855 [Streptosporangiaceae bacterium]|jgi:hypothetical protein